jgi:hypothetical protein
VRPIKVLARLDLMDPKQWQERLVQDASVNQAEGWTLLLTTTQLSATAAAARDHAQLTNSIVSLHHAKTGIAIAFQAIAGTFQSAKGYALLIFMQADGYVCVLVELASLLAFAKTLSGTAQRLPITADQLLFTPLPPDTIPNGVHAKLQVRFPRSSSLARPAPTAHHSVVAIADRAFLLTPQGCAHLIGMNTGLYYGSVPLVEGQLEVKQATLDVLHDPTSPSLLLLGKSDVTRRSSVYRVLLKEVSTRIKASDPAKIAVAR